MRACRFLGRHFCYGSDKSRLWHRNCSGRAGFRVLVDPAPFHPRVQREKEIRMKRFLWSIAVAAVALAAPSHVLAQDAAPAAAEAAEPADPNTGGLTLT